MLFCRDKIRKYVAIGAAALMLGTAVASISDGSIARAARFEPISKLKYTPALVWPSAAVAASDVIEVLAVDDDTHIDRTVPILGKPVVSQEKMVAYIKGRNPRPKLSCSVEALVDAYYKEGAAEGVRGDIALCQAIKETGTFNYGGDVQPRQNNFCGLGATGGGEPGYTFKTAQLGARAHIQHLLAYASSNRPKQALVDPRYDILISVHPDFHGKIKNWTGLNGKWAVPGNNYGQEILAIWREAKQGQSNAITASNTFKASDPRDAVAGLYGQLQRKPDDLALRNRLAQKETEAKLYNEALKDYKKVLEKDNKNVAAYIGVAQVYGYQKKFDEAEDTFKEGLKRNKKNPEILAARANYFAVNSKYKDAIKDLNEVLKQKNNDVSALYNRSSLLAMTKDYKKALKDYDELIKLAPDKVDGYYNRGVVYEQQKKLDLARADYRKVLNLDRDNSDAANGIKRIDAAGKKLMKQNEDE